MRLATGNTSEDQETTPKPNLRLNSKCNNVARLRCVSSPKFRSIMRRSCARTLGAYGSPRWNEQKTCATRWKTSRRCQKPMTRRPRQPRLQTKIPLLPDDRSPPPAPHNTTQALMDLYYGEDEKHMTHVLEEQSFDS